MIKWRQWNIYHKYVNKVDTDKYLLSYKLFMNIYLNKNDDEVVKKEEKEKRRRWRWIYLKWY